MRILIIHHCDSWGGAGVSLKDICKMINDNHDVTVCIPHYNGAVSKEIHRIEGIKVISIEEEMGMISSYNGGPHFLSRTFFRNLQRIKTSKKKIEKLLFGETYDIVILNSITLSWIAPIIKKHAIPVIIYIRETKVNNPGYYLCKLLIERFCSGVIYISNYDKEKASLKNDLQIVIRDCVNLGEFSTKKTRELACEQFGLDKDKFNILFVGGMDELKGYEIIESAMAYIEDPSCRLVVAGSRKKEKEVKNDRYIYVGIVFDMPSLYRACDVLVFPSTKAHQSRPAFEAGAFNLPVIISDFPETSTEIVNGVNGLTFTPSSSEELAKCIKRIKNDTAMSLKLGNNNYINTITYHDFNKCKKQMLEFCLLVMSKCDNCVNTSKIEE